MPDVVSNLVGFGRVLRRAGFDVPVDRLLGLIEALALVDMRSRDEVFFACRALLVSRQDQLETFTRLFDAFWRGSRAATSGPDRRRPRLESARPATPAAVPIAVDEDRREEPPAETVGVWSDAASLLHKDFAEFSPDEIARARSALARLAWTPDERRTRRWVRGRGPRVDVRRALARSIRTGGDVFGLPTRRRRRRARDLVLLCDVSGSMERYARLLVHFAHGMRRRHGRVEVFLFSTGLTRVTQQLRRFSVDDAARALSAAVPDWSGGTRIGPALGQLHRQWSRRVLSRKPVVLVISDGWDCGDPHLLREQTARLQRSAHRLVWLNPLIGTAGYAPLTRGLQAALPFVDDFLPARTLADLGDLAAHLNRLSPGGGGPRRREHA